MKTIINPPIEERLFCYQLLVFYYRGNLLDRTKSEWDEIVRLLKEQESLIQEENIRKSVQLLEEINQRDLEQFEYHYNQLFIGPGKLLASPFESSYRNFEQMTMQHETKKVRNFYHYGGLQVAEEGQIPDDHIQFELEFCLYMLSSEQEEHEQLYKLFLQEHLLKWCGKHCEAIINSQLNRITTSIAYLLRGLLNVEKRIIEGGK